MRGLVLALVISASACGPAVAPVPATGAASPASGATTAAPGGTEPATESPTGAPGPPTATAATGAMTWSRTADIPTPRSEVAAAVFEDAIYVVGGFGGTAVVERYVPATDRWERQPDLPIGVDHPMAAAVASGRQAGVYVFGGNSGGRAIDRAFHLPPAGDRWREIAAMPGPRSAGAAVTFEILGPDAPVVPPPKIYVVGGQSGGRLEAQTLEYDPATDSWRSLAPILTPRDHLAAAFFEGRVCAVGGRELSMARNLPAFECYEPGTDTWERLPAAPTARGGVGAAVVGRTLFFIGGEQPSGTFAEVEIYDLASQRWSRGPDLPTPRHGIGVVSLGNAVYVMTGGPTPGGSQTPVCEVLNME